MFCIAALARILIKVNCFIHCCPNLFVPGRRSPQPIAISKARMKILALHLCKVISPISNYCLRFFFLWFGLAVILAFGSVLAAVITGVGSAGFSAAAALAGPPAIAALSTFEWKV